MVTSDSSLLSSYLRPVARPCTRDVRGVMCVSGPHEARPPRSDGVVLTEVQMKAGGSRGHGQTVMKQRCDLQLAGPIARSKGPLRKRRRLWIPPPDCLSTFRVLPPLKYSRCLVWNCQMRCDVPLLRWWSSVGWAKTTLSVFCPSWKKAEVLYALWTGT